MEPDPVLSYLEEPGELTAEIERQLSGVETASITRELGGFVLRVDYAPSESTVFREEEEKIEQILEQRTGHPGIGMAYSGKKGSLRKYDITGVEP